MRTLAIGLAFFLCSLLGAPLEAEAADAAGERFGVEFDAGTRLVYSGSYELFSERPGLVNAQLSFQWLPDAYGESLALDLRLAQAGSTAPAFDLLDSSLYVSTAMIGAAYRRPLIETLFVVGRAGLGADYVRVRLGDDAGAVFRGSAFAPVLEGTAGLEAQVAASRGWQTRRELVLRLEGGYGWRPFGARIRELARDYEEDDPAPIERNPVDLGNIDLSGFVIRCAIGYRF